MQSSVSYIATELCDLSRTYHVSLVWCRLVLAGPLFSKYFQKVEVINFEVASDAFSTLKVSRIHGVQFTALRYMPP